jgi:hypothetical protein
LSIIKERIIEGLGGFNIKGIPWLAIFVLLFAALSIDSFAAGSEASKEYLFIEVWEHQDGKVISGKAYKTMIDFPTYVLENSALNSMLPVNIESRALAILGTGSSLSGDLGGGAASGLDAVNEVPHVVRTLSGLNISIVQIERDNVTMDLNGRQIVLGPGESWKKESTETRSIQNSLMKVTTTLTIWNHGRVVIVSSELEAKGGDMI